MWLSAIHRDLPKTAVSFAKKTPVPNVGVAKFERVEEGQFVVTDHKENEFMLYHPEVDTSEICEGVFLLSWQDPETKEWKWCTANPLKEIENGYGIGEIYVEPAPH